MLSNSMRWITVWLVLFAGAACSADDDDTASVTSGSTETQPAAAATATATATTEPTQDIDREPMTITTAAGGAVDLQAELAVTPEERSQGLMGRTALDPDSGMLFVIQPPGRGFWMKDTPIALTIAFIGACGEIVALIDMEPLSEEVKNADRPYNFALEMEQGWFSENGVDVGDVVALPTQFLATEC